MAGVDTAALAVPDWLERPGSRGELADALSSTIHAERWKYTSADEVLTLIDAAIDPGRTAGPQPTENELRPIRAADSPEAFIALARANALRAIDAEGPLTLQADGPTVVRVGDNTAAELTELFDGSGKQVHLLWIVLGSGSRLTHSRQSFTNDAEHWQFLQVIQERDSNYTLHNHCLGAALRRQDIQVRLEGPGAEFELQSAAYVAANLHLDQQITVEHVEGHSKSRQKIHNIGADKATVVCNGRIHIHPGASKSDADLSNRNLALGANTTINAKPELEIYTDDVQCSHGATVGQLSEDQIFYSTSRGISPREARRLLSKGFLLEGIGGPHREAAIAAVTEALA